MSETPVDVLYNTTIDLFRDYMHYGQGPCDESAEELKVKLADVAAEFCANDEGIPF